MFWIILKPDEKIFRGPESALKLYCLPAKMVSGLVVTATYWSLSLVEPT